MPISLCVDHRNLKAVFFLCAPIDVLLMVGFIFASDKTNINNGPNPIIPLAHSQNPLRRARR